VNGPYYCEWPILIAFELSPVIASRTSGYRTSRNSWYVDQMLVQCLMYEGSSTIQPMYDNRVDWTKSHSTQLRVIKSISWFA